MKKSMKIMAFALSAVMMLGALSGCGDKPAGSDADVTTISVWTVNSHSQAVYEKVIGEWNETTGKEKGIYIDYQVKPGDSMAQNLELALQSGTAPDFFGSGDVRKLADNGDIYAIEDLPGTEELMEKFKDFISVDANQYNGKTYTLPVNRTVMGLVYNKDMFKAAGIVDENGEPTPPTTYAEVREYAKKLTNPDAREYGIVYPAKWSGGGWFSSDMTSPAMASFGYTTYNPATGKYDYTHLNDMIQTIMDIKEDGSVYPGAESLDNDSARALFSEGKIGMKFAFSFDVGVFNDQFPATCDWGVAPQPVMDENQTYAQYSWTGGTPFINKNSKATPEQLVEVLKLFTSDEFVQVMYKEGVDLPYSWDVVKDVELGEDAKNGWKEFAEIVGISADYIPTPKQDWGGLRKPEDIFLEDIYSGKVSVAEATQAMTDSANKAAENYYAAHTDEDAKSELYYNPDWKPAARD